MFSDADIVKTDPLALRSQPPMVVPGDGRGRAPSAPVAVRPVNILVVDDHAANRVAIKSVLTGPAYRLVEASSGEEALLCLLREDFALILLDVVMPGMSGLETATLIKQRARTRTVPIIFLSAESSDLDVIYQGYTTGAVDYLVKPVVPGVLRAKVAVFAELYQQREQIREQAERLRAVERGERETQLAELRLSTERRYRNLAESIPQIVWTARPDGLIDYFNERWFEYTGFPARSGAGWASAIHPDDLERCTREWKRVLASGEMYHVECRLRRGSDGAYRWHLCRAVAERGPVGEVVSWLGTFTDIDDQRRAHAVLAEFKASLDTVADAVWIFEPGTWRFIYANQGAGSLLGYTPDELLRRTALDVLPGFDAASFEALLAPLRAGERAAITLETECLRSDGARRAIEISMQYVSTDAARFASIARDISDRRRAEDERARLLREAQDAVRARDEFLSVASHELNTPLTGLSLHLQTIMRQAQKSESARLPAQAEAGLKAAMRQIDRLARLVSELLDVGRITSGQLRLEREDVDLVALARDVTARFAEQIADAGCSVELHTPRPVVVGRWDRLRVEQVLTNLLSNAVKYGPGKPIEVTVDADAEAARLVVRDHGIGIAPEHQQRIFQRFERAVPTRNYGGLGLGLYIARQIVEALAGTIGVESAPGEGAAFVVRLPLVPPEAK